MRFTKPVALLAATVLAGGLAACSSTDSASDAPSLTAAHTDVSTATPIKHLVVVYGENISYDHYFGTYPKAANTDGTPFTAKGTVPKNDNLVTSGLLKKNPNAYPPQRLTPDQAVTCDQNHAYGPEQEAYDNGKMDKFVESTSTDTCSGGLYGAPGLAMDFFDGNTVTALWNYANRFAMSDNSFSSTFGPSTPGALNLVSGQTHGFIEVDPKTKKQVDTPGGYALASPDADGVGTVINDPDPAYDDCANDNGTADETLAAAAPGSKNIGDLLNAKNITWGWFQGGFKPTTTAADNDGHATCEATHKNISGAEQTDYSPHHNPFAYYKSTANPHHLPPSSVAAIGSTDRANHNYDLSDFDKALSTGHLPAVSFLKAASYQDGHAANSDPIDEQHFLVKYLNMLQHSKEWKSTAVVLAYDDSDGWYDHVASKVLNGSSDSANDTAWCSDASAKPAGGYQDRCGPGPRQPLLVVSPYAKKNFIDHTPTEQASITKFIEDNWKTGRIGDSSFDARAGKLDSLFDFKHPDDAPLMLKPNGAPMN